MYFFRAEIPPAVRPPFSESENFPSADFRTEQRTFSSLFISLITPVSAHSDPFRIFSYSRALYRLFIPLSAPFRLRPLDVPPHGGLPWPTVDIRRKVNRAIRPNVNYLLIACNLLTAAALIGNIDSNANDFPDDFVRCL